jgi:SAM-dependent methyltransferase
MNAQAPEYLAAMEELLAHRRPGAPASPQRTFRGADDDFWFWLNTEGYRQSERLRSILPSLPDDDLQVNTIGSSGDNALKEAFGAYGLFTGLFRAHVGALGEGTRVLDFGCGWGRMLRFFLRDVDQANLWGLDPGRFLINACRRTNPWCQFVEGRRMPPSPFASGYFDLIYSYSVFSHLSEAAHRVWLDEIQRILRPGGLLVATTWQREHIQRSEHLRSADPSSRSAWHQDLAAIWLDNPHWLAEYDAGRFCYQPYSVETHPWSYDQGVSYYGEACIPEQFVRSEWAAAFDVLEFINDRTRCAQNVIVVRRSVTGS